MSRDPINTALDVDFSVGSASPVGDYLKLWAAVLQRAILDLANQVTQRLRVCSSGAKGRLSYDRAFSCEAWCWVMSPNRGLGSFNGLCVALDLNPDAVRLALRKRFFK